MNKSLYQGTKKNFHHYIGPRLRNLIPPLTRKHKLQIGCCEHCGAINVELDAAHKHEINRRKIIDDLLIDYVLDDEIYKVDLEKFESMFIQNHMPLSKVILVLCKPCHVKYDGKFKSSNHNRTVDSDSKVILKSINNTKNNGVLKVGKLVQSSFKDLSNNSKLTTTEISNLQKLDYCKRVFNAGYEVLRKSSRSKLDDLGRTRYYASEVVPGYWLSSQWYETQRDLFLKWKKSLNSPVT